MLESAPGLLIVHEYELTLTLKTFGIFWGYGIVCRFRKQLGGKEVGGKTISVRSQSVIDALPRIHLNRIERAVQRATAAMLAMQDPAGYWWAELESNVTITAEYIMLHRFLGLDEAKVPRMAADILEKQLPNGGWSIWHGDGGEISTTVEAYLGLKMAGLPASDPRMLKAREFVLSQGGALKTRVFTRIFLALFGQVSWDGIPLLPVEFMLLPPWSGLSIYEFSSWTRATVVPLMIIMAKRPVRPLPPEQGIQELFLSSDEPFSQHRVAWKLESSPLENLFVILDRILKLYAWMRLPWPRNFAIKQAEKWILEHQEDSGDWGGIQPPMVNSLMALSTLGYANDHDVMQRGLKALEFFTLEEDDRTWLQSCISPVWDTGPGDPGPGGRGPAAGASRHGPGNFLAAGQTDFQARGLVRQMPRSPPRRLGLRVSQQLVSRRR